ncbi:unnamed protein product [marine sediment metagenome]|uniref:Uncharacterized protein n=1 Tax=marine sediment metagenome TaxID=412755 RepID=X0T6J5_9ZZZZ
MVKDIIKNIRGIIADSLIYLAFKTYSNNDKNKLKLSKYISKWKQ